VLFCALDLCIFPGWENFRKKVFESGYGRTYSAAGVVPGLLVADGKKKSRQKFYGRSYIARYAEADVAGGTVRRRARAGGIAIAPAVGFVA